MLSFLADQDAGERGMFVEFFGRPASTHKAIALLALEHRAPVVVGYATRIGPGFRYEVRCEEVIDPDEWSGTPDDARLLTQRYTKTLETIIRRDPEQYLWLHRRWKHQPKPILLANSSRPPKTVKTPPQVSSSYPGSGPSAVRVNSPAVSEAEEETHPGGGAVRVGRLEIEKPEPGRVTFRTSDPRGRS